MADQIPQAANDREALEMYVDQLIKDKNSSQVNNANRQEIKDALMRDVTDAINAKFVLLLSDDDIKELNGLFRKNAANDEISKFFAAKIPNQQEILTEVLLDFRKGYLSIQYPAREKLQSVTPAPVQEQKGEFTVPVAPPAPAPSNPSLSKLN